MLFLVFLKACQLCLTVTKLKVDESRQIVEGPPVLVGLSLLSSWK